ncbi:MAG TPA: FUSC family protein [Capillimicrobium sp.]|nr:FUSC family protein [Capillimicrobium sp.]
MTIARDLAREAFAVEERGLDWRSGVAGALAAVGPLAVGAALGDPAAGFTAALGGLNTALCVPRARLAARIFWGGIAATGGFAAFALALAVDQAALVPLLLATFAWVGAWAFWRAAGPPGALLGFATAAVFVIMAGLPPVDAPTGRQLLWFAAGAAPGLALMVVARSGTAPAPGFAREALATVRAGVAHDRSLQAHALRLALAVSLGTFIDRALDLSHGYWIPLTILAILQPGEHATHVRALQRAAGTLGGAAVILAITALTDARWLLLAFGAVCAGALYALDRRSYFWLVVLLTPTVLFMISAVDFEGDQIAVERVGESALGIAVGLAIGELAWRLHLRRPRSE